VTWVRWRQQRTETLIAAGVLVLLAALLVPTGLHMASVYDRDGLASCTAQSSFNCNQTVNAFLQRFDALNSLIGWFNLIPGVIGILLAAPFILELENGTFKLCWTQSVTRRRWLAGKLGITVAAALLAALAMTALMTWWRSPLDHLQGRMQTSVFDFEGTVGFGYVLFALGLALAIGAVWRRAVPALIISFAGYIAARIFVQSWLRERYESPLSSTVAIAKRAPGPNLTHAWILSEAPSDRTGHTLTQPVLSAIRSCASPATGGVKRIDPSCLGGRGGGYMHAVFQPASRFWLFQGIETALFGGIGLMCILFAAWWVHERTS
jgi:hypothetical protein